MKAFALQVVGPEGVMAEADVESLVLPGAAGWLGVQAGHEAWTVLLKRGAVSWKKMGGAWESAKIGGGVASIEGSRTIILADSPKEAQS